MSLSKNIDSYSDIARKLEELDDFDNFPCKIEGFESHKEANYWRLRANGYRRLLRQQNRDQTGSASSIYDLWIFRLKKGEAFITVEKQSGESLFAVGADGERLPLS